MSSSLPKLGRSLVYQSNSVNPYYNVALEEWLFRNADLTKGIVLFIYRNAPCVVIGRYQNPWFELNLNLMKDQDLFLVRRCSGGGTVFHDLENCNMSFISQSSDYNRKNNLKIITSVLKNKFSVDTHINDKMDIICRGCKVSGSASKLTRTRSYHHCTLLLRSNLSILRGVMKSRLRDQITTTATQSIVSPVANLSDFNCHLNFNTFTQSLIKCYHAINNNVPSVVYMVPDNLPCIVKLASEYSNWLWLYGKSPPFKLQLSEGLTLTIKSGRIHSIEGSDYEQCLNNLEGALFMRSVFEDNINKYPNSNSRHIITSLLPLLD